MEQLEPQTRSSQVGGIGQTLRDATYQKLTDQKTRASDTLGSVAGAVRGMTEPLREDGQSSVADYVDKAAEGIDRWAHQLRQRDINDTVRAVHGFARREPAVFLGLAFGAGVFLARFLKSSTADNHSSDAGVERTLGRPSFGPSRLDGRWHFRGRTTTREPSGGQRCDLWVPLRRAAPHMNRCHRRCHPHERCCSHGLCARRASTWGSVF